MRQAQEEQRDLTVDELQMVRDRRKAAEADFDAEFDRRKDEEADGS